MQKKKNMDILPKYKNWNEIILCRNKIFAFVHSLLIFGLDKKLVKFAALSVFLLFKSILLENFSMKSEIK